jgi:hypothetical protein
MHNLTSFYSSVGEPPLVKEPSHHQLNESSQNSGQQHTKARDIEPPDV